MRFLFNLGFLSLLTWGHVASMSMPGQTYDPDFHFGPENVTSTAHTTLGRMEKLKSIPFAPQATLPYNGIDYHNGVVMTGQTTVYNIWYGDFNQNTRDITNRFVTDLSTSSLWNVLTTYYSLSNGNPTYVVPNSLKFGASVNVGYNTAWGNNGRLVTGPNIIDTITNLVNTKQLPNNPNAIYNFMTAGDAHQGADMTSGYCKDFCGWHGSLWVGGNVLKMAFIGNPIGLCGGGCGGQASTSPNDPAADSIINVMTHELAEAVTSPVASGWWQGPATAAAEIADLCAWNFGPSQYRAPNGAQANQKMNGRDYHIQQLWLNANGGGCVSGWQTPAPTAAPTTAPATPAPATLAPTPLPPRGNWVSYAGFDSFPGANVGSTLSGTTVAAAESAALQNNFPGFVYCGNTAYFRSQDATSLVNQKVANSGCTLYVFQPSTPQWVSYANSDVFAGSDASSLTGTVATAEATALSNKWNGFVYCGSIAYFKAGDASSIVNAKISKLGCTLYVYQ